MAAVSSCAKALASVDCRSDHICSRSEIPSAGSAKFTGKSRSAASRRSLSSSLIPKFPPSFVRQLSTKALRNCSSIGVAPVVAAASFGVETGLGNGAGLGEDDFVDGGNGKLGGATSSEYASFLNSDGSLAIHAGERLGRGIVTDAITTPVVNTSAYFFKKTADLIDFKENRRASFEYGRYGNYTTIVAEEKISALEGAESTLLMASGMCASTIMLLALVPAGGHLVITNDCYRVTRIFIETVLPKMGITVTIIDPADIGALESALEKNKVALFFTESPTNPFLRCVDIDLVSKLCHAKGALVCIDGTFASPLNQKALALGADIILHSATKYIGGHNDVLGGCISGTEKVVSTVRTMHHILGGVINPNAAYLIIRGMKTLHLRIQQQNQTAQKMAEILEAHPKIKNVYYPGLASHPEHDLAKRQMKGFGGVVSFEVDGDLFATSKFIDALRIPYNAPSFGGCESIVDQPAIMSYWDLPQVERAKYGIMDNLVRFSFGVEDFDDLRNDVLQALETI